MERRGSEAEEAGAEVLDGEERGHREGQKVGEEGDDDREERGGEVGEGEARVGGPQWGVGVGDCGEEGRGGRVVAEAVEDEGEDVSQGGVERGEEGLAAAAEDAEGAEVRAEEAGELGEEQGQLGGEVGLDCGEGGEPGDGDGVDAVERLGEGGGRGQGGAVALQELENLVEAGVGHEGGGVETGPERGLEELAGAEAETELGALVAGLPGEELEEELRAILKAGGDLGVVMRLGVLGGVLLLRLCLLEVLAGLEEPFFELHAHLVDVVHAVGEIGGDVVGAV